MSESEKTPQFDTRGAGEEDQHATHEGEEAPEPLTGPGPGYPAGETLPEQAVPAGEAERSKEDVGFGSKSDKSDGSEEL